MPAASRSLWWFGVVTFFTLFAGEALRDTLSWYGFIAWDAAVLLTLLVVALVRRARRRAAGSPEEHAAGFRRLRRLPRLPPPFLFLAGFVGWAVLSLSWSHYRGATVLALGILLATTGGGLLLAHWLGWRGATTALTAALQGILLLSLLFELGVALLIGRPILPVFPIDVEPGMKIPLAFYWSRALLFEGGRIQGILGNANLLAFVALLALVLTACLLLARWIPRLVGVAGIALAVLMLALTRSSTVIVAALACAVVLALVLLWRRTGRGRRARGWAGIAVLAAVVGVVAIARGPLLALLGKSDDLTGRLDIWSAVAGLIAQHPVLGWGWISYWIPWVEPFSGLAVRNGVEYLQAHNAFLDVLLQLGPVGVVLLVGIVVATAIGIGRRRVGAASPASPGSGGSGSTPSTAAPGMFVPTVVLPALLLTALVTQAFAESRLLVEGNWALLCVLAAAASGIRTGIAPPTRGAATRDDVRA